RTRISCPQLEPDRFVCAVGDEMIGDVAERHNDIRSVLARAARDGPGWRDLLAIYDTSRSAREAPPHLLLVGRVDVVALTDIDRDGETCVRVVRDGETLRLAHFRPTAL